MPLTPVAREAPEDSLDQHSHAETDCDIAGPVSKEDYSRQHQAETQPPCRVSLFGGKVRARECQRTKRAGAPQRNRVEPIPRERYAAPMSADRQSIGPLLVKNGLEQVWQRRSDQRRQKNVVACKPRFFALVARKEPPSSRQRTKDMFIRAPGQRSGRLLDVRPGMRCDAVGNGDVKLRRSNCN